MTPPKEKLYNSLQKHVPARALAYCFELWLSNPFNFKIKKSRSSKLGDYRFNLRDKSHTITVNNDLNQYSFLVTYLHEVAHLLTFTRFGRKVKPHGPEWKRQFKLLALPVLNDEVFPSDMLRALASYFKNPKASSCSDHNLYKLLSQHDDHGKLFLSEIETGSNFVLGSRIFQKENLRRTRYVCREMATGKKYLISKSAQVEVT